MELFVLGLLLVVGYLLPLIWCFYVAYKSSDEFYAVFGIMPVMNIGLVGYYYEAKKEKEAYQKKKAKGLEEIAAYSDYYYIEIYFTDGTKLSTPKIEPYWSRYYESVVSSRENCENVIKQIINKEYYEKDECKYPYHTMSELCIKKWEADNG